MVVILEYAASDIVSLWAVKKTFFSFSFICYALCRCSSVLAAVLLWRRELAPMTWNNYKGANVNLSSSSHFTLKKDWWCIALFSCATDYKSMCARCRFIYFLSRCVCACVYWRAYMYTALVLFSAYCPSPCVAMAIVQRTHAVPWHALSGLKGAVFKNLLCAVFTVWAVLYKFLCYVSLSSHLGFECLCAKFRAW